MWVLSAVVIGGGLLGVLGMILFIPLTSVAYSLIRDWVKQREMMRLATQKSATATEVAHGAQDQESAV